MNNEASPSAALAQMQGEWASYLRAPQSAPQPAGTSARHMGAYASLLRNNIGGFIHQCFPLCRQSLPQARWEALIDRFFAESVWHHSPFFHEIPKAFVAFLGGCTPHPDLPPWFGALAHYEWVELAVDTAPDVPPQFGPQGLAVNPSCQLEAYEWPVHTITPDSVEVPEQPTFVAVFRNRQHQVRFSVLTPAAAQLLHLLKSNGCDWLAAQQSLAEAFQLSLDVLQTQTDGLCDQWLADELLRKQSPAIC
ncbi:MAG: putative DNA-binding domain-containing protein [Lautropia sp.]|nr:putative DNA-binding domain-containing protein [Lautropia sp.]